MKNATATRWKESKSQSPGAINATIAARRGDVTSMVSCLPACSRNLKFVSLCNQDAWKFHHGRWNDLWFLELPGLENSIGTDENEGKLYTWILRTVKPTLSSEEGCLVLRHGNLRNCRWQTLLSSELEHQRTYCQVILQTLFLVYLDYYIYIYLCAKCDMWYALFNIWYLRKNM